jgi:hypothetical protein
MAQPLTTPQALPTLQALPTPQALPGELPPDRKFARGVAVAGAVLGVLVLLGAMILWVHYGTAVFFEMIASGISACF